MRERKKRTPRTTEHLPRKMEPEEGTGAREWGRKRAEIEAS